MRNPKILLALLMLFVAAPLAVQAQTVQGVVAGNVSDATGALIPNAAVTLTNEGTNITQTTTTGSDGAYRFSLVPPGTYSVSVKAPGFAERVIEGIVVNASQAIAVDVRLEVTKAAQVVEVTTHAELVSTESADLTETVNRNTIENTPLLTRNVYDLVFLAPQVTQGMNFNPASGGARESGTAYLLNGGDNNDNFSEGGVNVTPPLESVAEFTLLTNQMGAQYGRAAGAVVSAIQKSGTNSIHGSLYEFHRDSAFNASDFFSNRTASPKPLYVRNQFGGEVDGPIKKDKAFFAFAYDQITLHTGGDLIVQGPTASELSLMSTNAGPLAQHYLSKYPPLVSSVTCPNEPASAIGHIGCTHVFDPVTNPNRSYYGRVDVNFSEKDRLSFTANIPRSTYIDKYGGGYPTTPIQYKDDEHYHHLALVETHTFSPHVLNELTVVQNRHYSKSIEGNGNFPEAYASIDGAAYDGFGFAFGAYEGGLVVGFVQDRWQIQDNLGWTVGKHSFKFGGYYQYGILYRNWDLGLPGTYTFSNTVGPTPASVGALNPDGSIANINTQTDSNFQNDFPYSQGTSIDPHTGARGNAYRHYLMKDASLFINDDWKVRPRLTLNLGLRWERYGAPTEQHNILAQFTNFNCLSNSSISFIDCVRGARIGPAKAMWNTRNHDFAPRVGFAYDVFGNGRTSLRAGYGISYDRIFDNVWSNGAWNPPFYALIDFDALAGDDTLFYTIPPSVSPSYVPDSIPGARGRVSVRTMENNLKDSSSQNYYLGVEHQFAQNFLFRVNYQGSMGRHLPVLMNWNRYDGDAYNPDLARHRPNHLYTGFNYRANSVTSNYNSLVLEIQKRFSHGLQFQGGYTWSHLLDFGSDLFTGSTAQGSYSQPYYFVSNQHQNLEYGTGAFDHRQGIKLNFIYELPFMRQQQGLLGRLAGGWQVSGFYQGYSGHPLEIYAASGITRWAGDFIDANGVPENIGGDYNLDGVYNDHPDFVGKNFNGFYSSKSPADGIFADNNPIGCGFPGAQSSAAAIAACNQNFGITTPNTLFVAPSGTGIRYGRLGRNVFHGPWYNGFDAAVFKNVKASERVKVQIRVEMLNFLNHPNFDFINTDVTSGQFGKSQGLAGAAPSRRIQLGARFLF
jgi:hypothetical protein